MASIEKPTFFLVTGHPRSGTTLITEVLSRHPDVYIPPETHFFTNPAVHRFLVEDALRQDLVTNIHAYMDRNQRLKQEIERSGDGLSDFVAFLRAEMPTSAADVFFALQRWFAQRHRCSFIGEKTPDHIEIATYLAKIDPGLRVVDIVRDPRDVALSHRHVPWGETNASFMALRWQRAMRRAERASRTLGERFLQMRYEDFVTEPETATRRLCAHLSLQFDPCMLSQSASKTYDATVEPWKAQASQSISGGRIGRWRDALSARDVRRIEALLHRDLVTLNYDVSFAQPHRPAQLVHAAQAAFETAVIAARRRLGSRRQRA